MGEMRTRQRGVETSRFVLGPQIAPTGGTAMALRPVTLGENHG